MGSDRYTRTSMDQAVYQNDNHIHQQQPQQLYEDNPSYDDDYEADYNEVENMSNTVNNADDLEQLRTGHRRGEGKRDGKEERRFPPVTQGTLYRGVDINYTVELSGRRLSVNFEDVLSSAKCTDGGGGGSARQLIDAVNRWVPSLVDEIISLQATMHRDLITHDGDTGACGDGIDTDSRPKTKVFTYNKSYRAYIEVPSVGDDNRERRDGGRSRDNDRKVLSNAIPRTPRNYAATTTGSRVAANQLEETLQDLQYRGGGGGGVGNLDESGRVQDYPLPHNQQLHGNQPHHYHVTGITGQHPVPSRDVPSLVDIRRLNQSSYAPAFSHSLQPAVNPHYHAHQPTIAVVSCIGGEGAPCRQDTLHSNLRDPVPQSAADIVVANSRRRRKHLDSENNRHSQGLSCFSDTLLNTIKSNRDSKGLCCISDTLLNTIKNNNSIPLVLFLFIICNILVNILKYTRNSKALCYFSDMPLIPLNISLNTLRIIEIRKVSIASPIPY